MSMKKFIIFSLMAVVLAACNPQQTAVDDLATFTERLEKESAESPLRQADDAILIDNSYMTKTEQSALLQRLFDEHTQA